MPETSPATWVASAAADRKAEDVVILDVRGRCSYTDYLVLATGTSQRHVQAIAEHVESVAGDRGQSILGREGLRQGEWALVDLGDVVLHVFHPFQRQEVNLAGLWQEAPAAQLPREPAAGAGPSAMGSLAYEPLPV